jgi:hypothetical protein
VLLILDEAETLALFLQLCVEEINRFKQNSLDGRVTHDFALKNITGDVSEQGKIDLSF